MKKIITLFLLMLVLVLPFPGVTIAASTPANDYQLPYPGILPDSPYYNLKIIRDKISGFFISNPFKKAEYSIHMADVRMSATLVLLEQENNTGLAKATISKAENYLEAAAADIKIAKDQGMNTNDIVQRLNQAKLKHQDIVKQIKKKNK